MPYLALKKFIVIDDYSQHNPELETQAARIRQVLQKLCLEVEYVIVILCIESNKLLRMSSTTISSCKLILFGRCLRGVILSVVVQYLLLTVFLLFVNFELLHPLDWLAGTLRLVCSWYTWFASILLISAVVLYGVTLTQQHLAERRYCATRYRWLIQNGPRKLLFLGAHLFLGYLTAWLYTGYLHTDYRFEQSTLIKQYNLH